MSANFHRSTEVKPGQLRGFRQAETPLMLIIEVVDFGTHQSQSERVVKYMMDGEVKTGSFELIQMYTEEILETQ